MSTKDEKIWINNPSELWSGGKWKNIIPKQNQSINENYNAATRLMMLTGVGAYVASGNNNVLYAISIILMVLLVSTTTKVREMLPAIKEDAVHNVNEGQEIPVEEELFPGANAVAERLVTNPREQDQFRFSHSTPTVAQYKLGRRPVQDQDQEFADLFNAGVWVHKYQIPNIRPRLFEPYLQEKRLQENQ